MTEDHIRMAKSSYLPKDGDKLGKSGRAMTPEDVALVLSIQQMAHQFTCDLNGESDMSPHRRLPYGL